MDQSHAPLSIFLDDAPESPDLDLRIRIDVDRNHCHRYAICEQEAPDVFQMRADGRLEYRSSPDPQQRDAVRQAARVCPMQAISVEERRR
ncbi:MAG: ferredoxin [Acidimicrobiales bacterium]